jgi:hypothetical protein
MRRSLLACAVIWFSVAGCHKPAPLPSTSRIIAPAAGSAVRIEGESFGDFIIAAPVRHKNLTIFPICSKELKNIDRYITLDEGIAAGTVRIVETGAGQATAGEEDPFGCEDSADNPPDDPFGDSNAGTAQDPQQNPFDNAENTRQTAQPQPPAAHVPAHQGMPGEPAGNVNRVLVYNTSGKPLYLMPGEIISGGKQDRTIAEELVIESSNEPRAIDVFCVEAGRWSGRVIESLSNVTENLEQFPSRLSLVVNQHQSVDETLQKARLGEFVASAGQLNKDVRLAVQDSQSQSEVWDKVEMTNMAVDNDTATNAFATIYQDPDVKARLVSYIEALDSIATKDHIVGVVVAVNGKVQSADWFESTPLFRKFWSKLLRSYALDAVAALPKNENDSPADLPVCSVDDCIAFLKDISNSDAQASELDSGRQMVKRQSDRAVSFSYYDAADPAAGATEETLKAFGAGTGGGGFGGGGGLGGAVHGSGYSK